MSFAELEQLRKNGGDSQNSLFQRMYGTTDPTSRKRRDLETKRASKNAPRELSSKKQVGRFKDVALPEGMREKVRQAEPHDPRFSKRHGKFNADLFKKSYGFLDDYRKSEMETMQKDMGKLRKRAKGGGQQAKDANAEFGEMQQKYSKMQQQMVTEHRTEKLQEVKRAQRKKEQGAVAEGKKPFYLKKSAHKELELKAKYNDLKEKGELKKFVVKKRKKNATKEHTKVPRVRR
jgi:ribosomal RNA-processing protein 36